MKRSNMMYSVDYLGTRVAKKTETTLFAASATRVLGYSLTDLIIILYASFVKIHDLRRCLQFTR